MTKKDAATTDEDAGTDDATTDDSGKSSGADSGAGNGSAGSDSLEDRIRKMVHDLVDPLLDHGGKSGRGTASDDEEAIYRKVKAAQDKLKAEEEKDGKLKSLEKTVEKLVEKPPARSGLGGKIQRWMWGSDDQ